MRLLLRDQSLSECAQLLDNTFSLVVVFLCLRHIEDEDNVSIWQVSQSVQICTYFLVFADLFFFGQELLYKNLYFIDRYHISSHLGMSLALI